MKNFKRLIRNEISSYEPVTQVKPWPWLALTKLIACVEDSFVETTLKRRIQSIYFVEEGWWVHVVFY